MKSLKTHIANLVTNYILAISILHKHQQHFKKLSLLPILYIPALLLLINISFLMSINIDKRIDKYFKEFDISLTYLDKFSIYKIVFTDTLINSIIYAPIKLAFTAPSLNDNISCTKTNKGYRFSNKTSKAMPPLLVEPNYDLTFFILYSFGLLWTILHLNIRSVSSIIDITISLFISILTFSIFLNLSTVIEPSPYLDISECYDRYASGSPYLPQEKKEDLRNLISKFVNIHTDKNTDKNKVTLTIQGFTDGVPISQKKKRDRISKEESNFTYNFDTKSMQTTESYSPPYISNVELGFLRAKSVEFLVRDILKEDFKEDFKKFKINSCSYGVCDLINGQQISTERKVIIRINKEH